MTTQNAVDHLDLVAAMSGDFADSQDIDATLSRGLRRIADTLGAEAASLFLRAEDDAETLVCRSAHGPVEVRGLRLSVHDGIVGRTVLTQAPQMVRDVRQDPDFQAEVDALTGFTTRSILCAPMRVRGETLGAIELINRRDGDLFDTRDCRLLETLASAAGLAVVNARMADAMVERARLKREVELAVDVQRAFLPAPQDAGFPVHGINRPANEASGDFYDIVERGDGAIWFNLADVAGKGMNAAMVMAETAGLFRYLARTLEEPWEVLRAVNAELHGTARRGMFVTMTCGVLDPDRRHVRLANAGHMPTLLRTCRGAAAGERLAAEAPPLGVLADLTGAPARAQAIPLDGRCVYLFSDGLTESLRSDGTEIGLDGLEAQLRAAERAEAAPDARLTRVLDAVAGEGGVPADDLTLLVVEAPA